MQYFVFSDIHGNVHALERVIEEIELIRPDVVVSLGDVVGYGANPGDCVDLVQEYTDIRIGGNHDLAAIGLIECNDFNPTAKRALQWTADQLNQRQRDIIETYDLLRKYSRCTFTHASPVEPLEWEYIYTVKQAENVFEHCKDTFIFIGHTHVPGIITYNERDGCSMCRSSILQVELGTRYLVNVGSIGQPRDGIAAASFALLDIKKGRLSLRRVPYDIESAQENIRSVGLPESLALRLGTAR